MPVPSSVQAELTIQGQLILPVLRQGHTRKYGNWRWRQHHRTAHIHEVAIVSRAQQNAAFFPLLV